MILCLMIIVVSLFVLVYLLFSRLWLRHKWKKSLKGKIVLVTGSANGLGKNLCLTFAREQCHLICVDIDEKANEDTVDKVRKISDSIEVRAYTVDVTNLNQVAQLRDKILNEFEQGVDILVNNAGIVHPSHLLELTDEHVARIMNTNCIAHLWLIRAFLPKMLERDRGHIVTIGSMAIFTLLDSLVPYYGSKFGATGIIEALGFELRTMKSNVKTLLVHPSLMHTRLLPRKLFDLGTGINFINKLPVQILDTKDVAQGVVNSIKDGRRVYYTPYYHYLFLQFINSLPQFIRDFILVHCAKIHDLLDPLEMSR